MERVNLITVIDNKNELTIESENRSSKLGMGEIDSSPFSLNPLTSISNFIDNFENITELDPLRVVGKVLQCKGTDSYIILTLSDQSGIVQIYLYKDYIGERVYNHAISVDIGDILRIDGARFITDDGEMSIKGDRMQILSRVNRQAYTNYMK